MTTYQLECFISLANTLNYMKTSEQVGLTQPAVTKQIKSLEIELGCKLFHRTTRSVSLTAEGASFLTDARQMIDTFYRSKDRILSVQKRERHILRLGYMDPHMLSLLSKILYSVLSKQQNLTPELYQDQTDKSLSRLVNNQLDLIIGMKDSKFSNPDITFTFLRDESFVCAMRKDSELAEGLLKKGKTSVTTKDVWDYRQIIAIPPYLLNNFFSRGRHIVPVNDDIDNSICSNANEAYGLILSGFGYAYLPEHEIIDHPDIITFKWDDSPHAPFGIYSRTSSLKEKTSLEYIFLSEAKRIVNAAER